MQEQSSFNHSDKKHMQLKDICCNFVKIYCRNLWKTWLLIIGLLGAIASADAQPTTDTLTQAMTWIEAEATTASVAAATVTKATTPPPAIRLEEAFVPPSLTVELERIQLVRTITNPSHPAPTREAQMDLEWAITTQAPWELIALDSPEALVVAGPWQRPLAFTPQPLSSRTIPRGRQWRFRGQAPPAEARSLGSVALYVNGWIGRPEVWDIPQLEAHLGQGTMQHADHPWLQWEVTALTSHSLEILWEGVLERRGPVSFATPEGMEVDLYYRETLARTELDPPADTKPSQPLTQRFRELSHYEFVDPQTSLTMQLTVYPEIYPTRGEASYTDLPLP